MGIVAAPPPSPHYFGNPNFLQSQFASVSLSTTGNFRKAALSSSNQAYPFHNSVPLELLEAAPLTSKLLNNTCERGTSFISEDVRKATET